MYHINICIFRIGNGIGSDDGFWLIHGPVKIHKLSIGINDVKHFLKNTRELVIFNVHTTPEKDQDKLIKLLINEFRPWLVKPMEQNWNTKMSDIWSREGLVAGQGRIIIHYYDKAQSKDKYFFPTPEKEKGEKWNDWGNKQKVCDNVEFLKKKVDT